MPLIRHPRESGGLGATTAAQLPWVPAFAGMTKSSIHLTASPPHCEMLKEKGQVLGQQHVLVQYDFAARDLPLAVDPPQQILALADQDVGLGLDPIAVDQKPASDRDLLGVGRRGVDLE